MSIIEYLRQFRVGPFAIFDFAISYLGVYLLSPYIIRFFAYFNISITQASIIWLVLPISILIHIILGNYTPLTKMFIDIYGYYFLKIIVLYMVYAGLKGVSFKQ
jgi:hypothetical protein